VGESNFIVPPPGLVPPAPQAVPDRTVRAVPRTLPTFPPGAPVIGAPAAPLPAPPRRDAAPPIAAPPTAAPAPPEDSSAAPVSIAWRLVAASGFEAVVDAAVVLGRDPRPAVTGGARAIAVDDPARTVSKTHAAAEPLVDGLLVTDLQSTNGVRVEAPGEPPRELLPGEPTVVHDGAVLYLGEFGLRLERVPRPA
jgi:hypothetical protein